MNWKISYVISTISKKNIHSSFFRMTLISPEVENFCSSAIYVDLQSLLSTISSLNWYIQVSFDQYSGYQKIDSNISLQSLKFNFVVLFSKNILFMTKQ